jgi:hypothetical protein
MRDGRMKEKEEARNLKLIAHEIRRMQHAHFVEVPPCKGLDKLTPETFSATVAENVLAYLNQVKKVYQKAEQEARLDKNAIVKKQLERYGKSAYLKRKNKHTNDAVETYVRDKIHLDKTYEGHERLIRRKDPIYMLPDQPFGRAHFYAPYKKVGTHYVHTLVFNLMFLWFGTLVFYLALQMNLLRRLLQFVEKIYLRYSKVIVHRRL